ncbi:MAG TPA: hypothetical protein VEW42_04050 [Candidatus Eisenbacteria bacterium]|nr:hypothetical protein [Candidatus Eisenbacteria bacterium]
MVRNELVLKHLASAHHVAIERGAVIEYKDHDEPLVQFQVRAASGGYRTEWIMDTRRVRNQNGQFVTHGLPIDQGGDGRLDNEH